MNIFKNLLSSYPVYIQLHKDKITARTVQPVREISVSAVKPFSHKRSIIGDFNSAETLLKDILHRLFEGKWFAPSPLVIIHPMELIDGGLTQIEVRALMELGAGAGARKVYVYVGDKLSNRDLKGDLGQIKFE